MKKVISIIAITLVALLVGATVTLACVKTNTPDVLSKLGVYDNVNYVKVYKEGSEYQVFDAQNSDVVKKIVELHKDAHKENTLSALFQGATGYDASFTTLESSISKTDILSGNICISFILKDSQNLVWNKKEILNSKDKNVTYKEVLVQLNNSENFADVNVYIMNETNSSLYKVKTVAHQAKLYSYVSDMEYSGN